METLNLVDSHCHLDLLDLALAEGELSNFLAQAKQAGVCHILCVSVTLTALPNLLAIAQAYPGVSASVGLHPTETTEAEPTAADLIALANQPSVVAVGETGLDYFRLNHSAEKWAQQQRFRQHIRAAKAVNKPLIVHTRDAKADTLQILHEEDAAAVGGVLHCFTEDFAMAQAAMAMGFLISFSGIVTFHNANALREVAQQVPLTHLLVETDAPYLAPVPYRGKPNQPAYVRNVAEYLANLRGLPLADLAAQTTQNFFKLFGLAAEQGQL